MKRFESNVQANQERFLGELQEFCRKPSIIAQGFGIEETAEWVCDRLRRSGFESKVVAVEGGAPVVYGEIGSGDKTLMMYNHYDVQPPEPLELWDSGPFDAEIRAGRVWARGVSDNKGPLMARVQAIEAYQQAVGELPIRIKWVIEGEEEIGSPNLGRFVDENRELLEGADACLWEGGGRDGAGRPVISLGMKGIAYLGLSVSGAGSDLHSMNGAIVGNPAWRLIWALASLKDENENISVDGLMDYVAEPTEEEWAFIRRIPFDEEESKRDFGITSFLKGATGTDVVKQLLYDPTCTVCGFLTGYTGPGPKTVLPNEASAKVDFRLVPDLNPELVLRLVREHLDRRGFTDVNVELLAQLWPYRSPVEHAWVNASIAVARAVFGAEPVVYPSSAGGGPMYQLCGTFGIPGIAGGGAGNPNGNLHAPNENIYVEDYMRTIRYTGHLIDALGSL